VVKDANGAVNVISDSINFQNSSTPFSLSYVPGSAIIYNEAHTSGAPINDSIVGPNGALIGYENMDGNLPGCFQYVGLVTIKVKINMTQLSLEKKTTIPGSTDWQKSLTANPGDAISWLLTITNTSTTTNATNVVAKDQMPANLQLIPGSVLLVSSIYPSGTPVSDTDLFGTGQKFPDLAPGAVVHLRYRTTIKADLPDNLCDPTIKNIGSVTATGLQPIYSDASVKVVHPCATPTPVMTPVVTPAPLPATGPVSALGGAMGVTGLGYAASAFVRSRRSLKDVLRKK
jgi:uncharacterized repeat protein (TIGR01451 family)